MQKSGRVLILVTALLLMLVAVQPNIAQANQAPGTAHLIAKISQTAIVGDFFINDQGVGAQVHQIELDVAAGTPLKIVVRNVNPITLGYRWLEATTTVTVLAGKTKTVFISVRKERLLTSEKLAAINSMQRSLDAGRKAWFNIASKVWTPIGNGESVRCSVFVYPAAMPRLSQSFLKKYPLYKDAFDMLTGAITTTNFAIHRWDEICNLAAHSTGDTFVIPDAMYFEGIAAKNNAEAMFNSAQDKIKALATNPQ